MSFAVVAIGGGIALAAGVGGAIAAHNANKKLSALQKKDPTYQQNPLADQRLGYANQLLNARAPGTVYAQSNIDKAFANQSDNIQRNATDSSQALAMGAGAQGQADNAYSNLFANDANDYYNRLNILTAAQQGKINEGDKSYQDMTRRFGNSVQIAGAQAQNTAQTWKTFAGIGTSIMGMGMSGGFGGMGSGSPMQASYPTISSGSPWSQQTAISDNSINDQFQLGH